MASSSYALRSGSMRADFPVSRIRFGGCEMLPHTRELFVDGQACCVEPKVFDLVLYLILERERVVLKDELLENIWPGVIVSECVVARTVMKARKAFGERRARCRFIKTMHGIGYRFVADVEICIDGGIAAPGSIDRVHLPMSATACIGEDRNWTPTSLRSLAS